MRVCRDCRYEQAEGKFCKECGDNDWKEQLSDDLEKEFAKTANIISNQIKEEMKKASVHYEKALKLSDEHGIPFYDQTRGEAYIPESLYEKFSGIDGETVKKYLDVANLFEGDVDYEHSGWMSSSSRC